jgi:ankyrin repeat protein
MKLWALALAGVLLALASGWAQTCPDLPIGQDSWRGTPLHQAIRANDVKVARRLLNPLTINEKDSFGDTPLVAALTPTEILEPIGIVSPQRRRELIRAENQARQRIVMALLAKGASVNERGALGVTPLIKLAASHYDADADRMLAERIIAMGADVNARDAFGSTALIVATQRSKSSLAALLLSKGADPALANCRGETAGTMHGPAR